MSEHPVENRGLASVVNSCFDRVAKQEYVKHKWISFDVYIDLMRKHSNENQVLLNLSNDLIKRTSGNRWRGY